MREQIRLWFYSQCFMAVTLVGRSPYRRVLTYEKLLDEDGREMHRSWGNAIDANDAFERMGADVMRRLFCEIPPAQNLKFGYGPANEVKRRLLKLWESAKFLVLYGNIGDFRPEYGDLVDPPAGQPLDAWLVARTRQLVAEATAAYDRYWTPAVVRGFDAFVEDLSNWYIRRSRTRFWSGDEAALRTLWVAVVQSLRVIAPVMPFLADELWRVLVADACRDAPDSVHLAGWPEAAEPDSRLLEEIAEVRELVELGRQARAQAGIKLRQPLRQVVVFGAKLAPAHAEEIKEELRVDSVRFEEGGLARVRFKPNLPVLGPRLGARLPEIRRALEQNEFELQGDNLVVDGEVLTPADVLQERLPVAEGWVMAADGDLSVELDPALDDDLELRGRVFDLVHAVNVMRKEADLDLTDRIVLTVPEADGDLLAHEEHIKQETLSTRVELGETLAIEKA